MTTLKDNATEEKALQEEDRKLLQKEYDAMKNWRKKK